jgi:hypothetical protein
MYKVPPYQQQESSYKKQIIIFLVLSLLIVLVILLQEESVTNDSSDVESNPTTPEPNVESNPTTPEPNVESNPTTPEPDVESNPATPEPYVKSNNTILQFKSSQYKKNDVCIDKTLCDENEVEVSEGDDVSDRICECKPEYFKSGNSCTNVTTCSLTQFETKKPTKVSDRECKDRQICGDQYITTNDDVYNKDTICVKHKSCEQFKGIDCTQGHYGKCSFVYMRTKKNSPSCVSELKKINKLATGNENATENYPFKCFYTGWAGNYMRLTKDESGVFASSADTEAEDFSKCKGFANKIKSSGLDVTCYTDTYKNWKYHYLGFQPKCEK